MVSFLDKCKLGAHGWLSWLTFISLLDSAQVMISWFMSLSPSSGSVLTVWSLLQTLSLPLSLSLPCPSPLSLSFKISKL